MRHRVFWIFLTAMALVVPLRAAPPTLNYFYPLGIQRGKTLVITASGSFAQWPVQSWVNRPGLTVTPQKAKGKLEIQAAPDARGIYLIRLSDAEGGSAVRPFVVDAVTDVVEKEPNATIAEAQLLMGPTVVNGRLNKAGDFDTFAIMAKAGQTIAAVMTANRIFGSPMDAVVQICDSRGFVVEQNDDSGGLDPLATYVVPQDGRYHVRVFAFPEKPNSSIRFAGADAYLYRLTISSGECLDFSLPLVSSPQATPAKWFGWNLPALGSGATLAARQLFAAAGDAAGFRYLPAGVGSSVVARDDSSPTNIQAVSLPVTISGRVETPRDSDVFEFDARKGQSYRFSAAARSLGFPLDPLLQIRDAKDKLLQENDDVSRGKLDPQLVFKAPADGKYRVEIRDVNRDGGARFAYRLIGQPVRPDFEITVAQDRYVVVAGKSVDVTVNVNRQDGFAKDIELSLVDLPVGMEAAPVASKGKKSGAIKIKLTGKTASSGLIRIVARVKGEAEKQASFLVPMTELRLQRFWVTCTKK